MTYNDEWIRFIKVKKFNNHNQHLVMSKQEFLKRRKVLKHIKEGDLDELVADIIMMRWLAEQNFVIGGNHPLAIVTRSANRESLSNRVWARPKK
jgi:hypothetical protein